MNSRVGDTHKRYDWVAIQTDVDAGLGYTACHRRYGVWSSGWCNAIKNGWLKVPPRVAATPEQVNARVAKKREQSKHWNKTHYHNSDSPFRSQQKTRVASRKKRIRGECKIVINEFKSNGCLLCDEGTLCCMVPHHINPAQKKFNISDYGKRDISVAQVRDELAKCLCLCNNCHDKYHAGALDDQAMTKYETAATKLAHVEHD